MALNLYLVSWEDGGSEYDTFLSFICCAANEAEARTWHPDGSDEATWAAGGRVQWENDWIAYEDREHLEVKLIGAADPSIEAGVVHASFLQG
jgi:hypothetical protein